MSKIAEQIIQYLKDKSDFEIPDYGVLAGQSVAEAYFRIKKIPIYTRIKDIDYFINLKSIYYKRKYSDYSRNIKNNFYAYHKTKRFEKINNSSFNETIYLDEKFVIEKENYYSIIDVFNLGNLNVVNVVFNKFKNSNYKEHIEFLKTTVDTFDLNSVQIGVCLKTKKLYLSDNFIDFIKNKEVKIINYNNIGNTICRFANKSEYYNGAYFNFYYEYNLISAFLKFAILSKKYIKGSKILLEKYLTLSNDSKKEIQKFFFIKENSFDSIEFIKISLSTISEDKKEYIKKYIKNNIIKNNIIKIINPNGKNFKKIYKHHKIFQPLWAFLDENQQTATVTQQKFIDNTDLNKLTDKNIAILISSKNINVVSFSSRSVKCNKDIRNNIKYYLSNKKYYSENLHLLLPYKNRNFLIEFFNKKHSQKISQFLFLHDNIHFLLLKFFKYNINIFLLINLKKKYLAVFLRHYNLLKIYILSKQINKNLTYHFINLAKNLIFLEKNNLNYIIGEIETYNLPVSLLNDTTDTILQKLEKFIQEKEKFRKLNNKFIPQIDKNLLKWKNYKINHINSTNYIEDVGEEMHHCAGGYKNKLLNINTLFFDIYDEKNVRYTLEVDVLYKNKKIIPYSILQIYGKYNSIPPKNVINDVQKWIQYLNCNLNYII